MIDKRVIAVRIGDGAKWHWQKMDNDKILCGNRRTYGVVDDDTEKQADCKLCLIVAARWGLKWIGR